jgi:hypothetical protein
MPIGASVVEQIEEWAEELPPWQSDAVRLLLRNGNLNETDKQDHLEMLRKSKGIPTTHRPPELVTKKSKSDETINPDFPDEIFFRV